MGKMTYRLNEGDRLIANDMLLLDHGLECYDALTEPDMSWGRDFLLHERSACELVRDQLSNRQRAELDQVDAYWRAHAADFNEAFKILHHQEDRKTALRGFVEDQDGNTPAIPRTHWWWRPIAEEP